MMYIALWVTLMAALVVLFVSSVMDVREARRISADVDRLQEAFDELPKPDEELPSMRDRPPGAIRPIRRTGKLQTLSEAAKANKRRR